MNRATRALSACVLLALSSAPAFAQGEGFFRDGRWAGKVSLGGAGGENFALRLFPADPETGAGAGGLVDMPSRGIFGFPIGEIARDDASISFSLRGDLQGGAPFDGRFELRAELGPAADGSTSGEASSEKSGGGASGSASGEARLLSADAEGGRKVLAEGSFALEFTAGAARGADFGVDRRIDTGRGLLPASLLAPELAAGAKAPAVLLLSGAQADRDGNNYSVPGRSDSMALLAQALRARGIASLRYDRRGTGEAYDLAPKEEDSRFDDQVEDARAALRYLAADPRFSPLILVGAGEGALVAACALEGAALPTGTDLPAARAVGLVALCESGKTEVEQVEAALSSTPEELRGQAEAIMAAVKAGIAYPEPDPYFADYFRPSIQPYLTSLFKRDIRAAFAGAGLGAREGRDPGPGAGSTAAAGTTAGPVTAASAGTTASAGTAAGAGITASAGPLAQPYPPVLVIAGGSDLQVPLAETEILAAARPDAAYRVVPGMSHALKGVGDDEEANYASFTNPDLPLAGGLVDLVAAFCRGETLPGEDPRLAAGSGTQGAEDSGEGLAR